MTSDRWVRRIFSVYRIYLEAEYIPASVNVWILVLREFEAFKHLIGAV
jgi:hypothetical protein